MDTRIGGNIRRRRRELDLTQEQLAEKAEVSADTIVKIEHGHRAPRAITLEKIANALRMSPADLWRTEEGAHWLDAARVPLVEWSDEELAELARLQAGGQVQARFVPDDPEWLEGLSRMLLREHRRLREKVGEK